MRELLIFVPSIEDGGVEKNLFLVSNYLQANNYSVNVLKLKSLGFEPEISFDEGLKSLCS